MGHKGQSHHYKPFPQLPASSASVGTGRSSHLSRPTAPLGWGLLHPLGLWGPERCPSQSLLGINPGSPCLGQDSTDAGGGWVLKLGVGIMDLGRATLLAVQIQHREWEWGDAWPEMPLEEACLPGKWFAIFERHTGSGATTTLICQLLPPWGLGGMPTRVSMPQSVPTAFWSHWHRQLADTPIVAVVPLPQYEWVSMPQAAAAFAPSHLGKEQMPEGGAHAEVGSKPKLSPRGSATKEEEWKSFHAAAQVVD